MPTFRECSLSNDDIRLQYITDLKHSQFNLLCVNNEEECTMNNVNISCTLP
ncbi:hypothetical protein DPMN_165519 [Dreissena polymorpha]|uniref:Uncharacterized protein n=2 Tax=Dreissena polymorpha TaxID=45954 RepID=A0A9D4F0F4_DREPO|nr:hypothetical protein DPMN_165519 [Dreissena polymorpha]